MSPGIDLPQPPGIKDPNFRPWTGRMSDEPDDGSVILATYRNPEGGDFEIVWQRADRNPGQAWGDWYEIRAPRGFCTHCGTTRGLRPPGPSSWGEVCGADGVDPGETSNVSLVELIAVQG